MRTKIFYFFYLFILGTKRSFKPKEISLGLKRQKKDNYIRKAEEGKFVI